MIIIIKYIFNNIEYNIMWVTVGTTGILMLYPWYVVCWYKNGIPRLGQLVSQCCIHGMLYVGIKMVSQGWDNWYLNVVSMACCMLV
jgi:hypothetical protein